MQTTNKHLAHTFIVKYWLLFESKLIKDSQKN